MAAILGSLIYIILGVACTVGLIIHFNRDKKLKCQHCSQIVHSSQMKCNYCGNFLEKKMKNESRIFKNMNRKVNRNFEDGLKQIDRIHSDKSGS